MEYRRREEIETKQLPGRGIADAVGPAGAVQVTSGMKVGFAVYSGEYGAMEPHRHAEETVYIRRADRAWVEFGGETDALQDRMDLEEGMVLYFPADEWHVFRYAEGGMAEILFIFGD